MANVDVDLRTRKLNVGCGWDKREGYLNVDLHEFHEPDLVADVRDLSQLPSGHFDEVLAQDVLEHLERTDIDRTLAEWARLLRPGGRLVVRVPDILGIANLLLHRQGFDEQSELLQCLFGTQAYTGDYHQAGFTEVTLRTQLHAVGLEVESLEHHDHWLFDCVSVKVENPGALDLGPLPFMALESLPFAPAPAACPEGVAPAPVTGSDAGLVAVDRAASAVAARLPDPVGDRVRRIWRPLRSVVGRRLARR